MLVDMLFSIVFSILGGTNRIRWNRNNSILKKWIERTEIVATLIEPNCSVLEFGAGNMLLRELLPKGCNYTASDIVSRGEGTIVCDLNAKILPDLEFYDVIVFIGVLEYINDVNRVISYISKYCNNIIISYSMIEEKRIIEIIKRRIKGWVNDLSYKQIIEIFDNNKFVIKKIESWGNQKILMFNRKDNYDDSY